jgi:hypothetical protein
VTPGNVEFFQVVTSMTVSTGGVAAILYVDQRRLSRLGLYVPWLPATLDAAVLGTFLFSWAYGAPAIVIHFVRSRWSLAGIGLGVLWAVLLVATDVGAQLAVEAAIAGLRL